MPIRPEHRYFYPIDWPQLSAVIRFGRARGCCEGCGRPHGRMVYHLGDGRWWDADAGRWRDGYPALQRPMWFELEYIPPKRIEAQPAKSVGAEYLLRSSFV